jgi:hypothetical protein
MGITRPEVSAKLWRTAMAKKSAASKRPAKKSPAKKAAKKAPKKVAPKKAATRKAPAGKAAAASVAPSGSNARDRALSVLAYSHKSFGEYAFAIPESQATTQPAGHRNHALWQIGHMAVNNQWFAHMIDGRGIQTPAAWNDLFGMGSEPKPDASIYPPLGELKAAFTKSLERITDAAHSYTDAELNHPCTGESGGFLTDKMDSILKAAWHHGYHTGQVATLKKALGA